MSISSRESGPQFADEQELMDLHHLTRAKLLSTCMPQRDSEVLAIQDGLYVANDPAYYTLELSAEEVRRMSSVGAEVLKVYNGLHLTYMDEYYQYNPAHGHTYSAQTCTYESLQSAEDPIKCYWYSIMVDDRGGNALDAPTSGRKEIFLHDEAQGRAVNQGLRNLLESISLESRLGLNRISREECRALRTIVDVL